MIDRLLYVRLHPQIGGSPETYFNLEAAFEVREMDKLILDETIEGVDAGVEFPTNRLEEVEEGVYGAAQIHLTCDKLKKTVTATLEDQLKAMHDPLMLKLKQVDFAFAKKKNDLALAAIKDGIIHNVTGGSTLEEIADIDAIATGSEHSTNDVVKTIDAQLTAFIKQNSVPIDCIIMSTANYLRITRDTHVERSGILGVLPKALPYGGVRIFPQLGIEAVIDPAIPTDKMYFINKHSALRYCRGPIFQKSWENHEKDNMCISKAEFINFFSVDALLKGDERDRLGGRVFSFAMDVAASGA